MHPDPIASAPPEHQQGRRRRLVEILGALVGFFGLAWALLPTIRQAETVAESAGFGRLGGAVLAAAPLYALALVLLALAWWWTAGLDLPRPPAIDACAVWLRTQVAKYFPGNVFHYVGRHLLGRALGLTHAALVVAAVLELVSLTLAALTISTSLLLGSTGLPSPTLPVAVLLVLLAVVAAPLVVRRVSSLPALSTRRTMLLLLPAFSLHLLFLAVSGLLLGLLVRVGWPDLHVPWGRAVGTYSVAWVLGTFTPGTPGGLGVREAVIAGFLAEPLGAANAGAVALALRLVTVGGDGLAAAAGHVLGSRG